MALSSLNPRMFALLALTALSAACATVIPLDKRVDAYWKAREARDFNATFELEDPRAAIEKAKYLERMTATNIEYRSVKVEEIRVQSDGAEVALKIVYRIPLMPKNVEGKLTDVWIRVGKQWYHRSPLESGKGQGGEPR